MSTNTRDALAALARSCRQGMESGDWGNFTIENWPELAEAERALESQPVAGQVIGELVKATQIIEHMIECGNWTEHAYKLLNEALDALRAVQQPQAPAVEVLSLLAELTPEEPCRFDHHGNCQEHGFFGLNGNKCPVEKAKELLNGR